MNNWIEKVNAHRAERPTVCFSSPGPDTPDYRHSDGARPQWDFGGFALGSNALAGGDLPTVVCLSIAAPAAPAAAVTRGGVDVPLPPRASGAMGLAPDWFILSAVGFLQRVTIQKLKPLP